MSPHHRPRLSVTCWVFTVCVVRNKSTSSSTTQSWVFWSPEWGVQVVIWLPRTSRTNFFTITSRDWQFRQDWNLCTDTSGKEGQWQCVNHELIKRDLNKRLIFDSRCDARLNVKAEGCTRAESYFVVYYESWKRQLKTKTIYGCRCDERLKN